MCALHDVTMPYFLQYVTGVTVGLFAIEGLDIGNILSSAQEAVRGLDCRRTALFYSPDPVPAFGKGTPLAAYTSICGWVIEEEGPE